jgi:hypothetical protein
VARFTKNGLHRKHEAFEESEPRYLSLMADDLETLIGLARSRSITTVRFLSELDLSVAALRRRAQLVPKHISK